MKKLLLTMIGALLAFAANAADWYLCGSALKNGSGSWEDAAAYKFTPSASDANIQTFSIASISGNIKIKEKGTWSTSFGTNGTKLKEGVEYKAGTNTDNITIDGTINDATITINVSAHTVKITGKGAENEYSEVYLVGDFGTGWNEALTTYPLTLKSGTDNVWEGTYDLSAAKSYFKMKAGSLVYGTGGSDIAVELGEEYTASQSGNAFNIGAGKYNFSFVLNHNADTGKLTVAQDGPMTYPETLYVMGNVKNADPCVANVTEPLPATAEAGNYEGDVTFTGTLGTGFSYFSLATATGSSATDWDGLGTRYGAAEEDLAIGTEPVKLTGNKDWGWKLADGTYTVHVNLVDLTMTVVKKEDPEPPTPQQPLEVTFDFSSYEGLCKITPAPAPVTEWEKDGSNGTFYNMVDCDLTKDNIVLHVAKGTASQTSQYPRYYKTTAGVIAYRINKTNNVTLSAPEGYELSEVVISTDGKNSTISGMTLTDNTPGKFTNNSSAKTTTWTKPEKGGVSEIKFNTGTANAQVAKIKVTLVKKETPAPEYPVLYFRGVMNDNVADDASRFTQTDGVYTLSLPKLIGAFKIADADWKVQFSTKKQGMVEGIEYNVYNVSMGDDMAIEGTMENVTITFNYETKKLKINGNYYAATLAYQVNSDLTVATWSKADMTQSLDDAKWEYVATPIADAGEMQIIRTSDGVPTAYYGGLETTISEANPTVTLSVGAPNIRYSLTAGKAYKFTFNPGSFELTVAPYTEPVTYPELYFRGAQNENAADDASRFTQTDGVYTLSLAKLNGNFKIADAEWNVQLSTKNTAMALGTEYAVEDASGFGGDMAIEGAAKDVTITFDYKAMKLKVEGTAFTPEVGYQLNSDLTVSTWSKADMVKTADNKWEYVVVPAAATGLLQVIRTEDGTPKDYLGSDAAEISEASPSATMAVGKSNLKYSLTAGSEYKFTFDPATSILTVAPTAEPVTYPELYFRGGNTNWLANEDSKMTETDGVYTFTLDKLNAEFKIGAADWDDAAFSTKNTSMEVGTEYDVVSVVKQEGGNMGMAKNLINATVTFDYKNMKLKVEGTVDDTPAVITYIIKGTFTEPAWDAQDMVKNDIDDTWSYTCPLAAATGEVLVIQLNDGTEKAWFKAAATDVISATNPEITVSATGAGNPKYDFDGVDVKEITFTFNPATGSLKATWTTGIVGISADFDPNAEYYNLQGVRVKSPAPGLYIVVRGTNVTKEYLK